MIEVEELHTVTLLTSRCSDEGRTAPLRPLPSG
jgi:hypothetical protein